jgi:hypothetical protein
LSSTRGRFSSRAVCQRLAPWLAHGAAGGVLEIGQHVEEAGTGALAGEIHDVDAFRIAGHAGDLRLHRSERLRAPR